MPADPQLVEGTSRFMGIMLKVFLPAFGIILLFTIAATYIQVKLKKFIKKK